MSLAQGHTCSESLDLSSLHLISLSYFVTPDTALDEEAQRRATTTYLVQKVFPMLPRLLRENLCSLTANTERLAFSVVWELDPKGRKVKQW